MAEYGAAYTIFFDPGTIARMTALAGVATSMQGLYLAAMNASVNQVNTLAKGFAPVGVYPTRGRTGGNLRRGIRGIVDSPVEGRVGVVRSVPYGHRREVGFSGQRDSLGRYYPHDPGSFYLKRAMQAGLPFINDAFKTAAQIAIHDIAATGV